MLMSLVLPWEAAYVQVMMSGIEVGALVRLKARPEWGLGQIQSIIGDRITVNFEHCGKTVLVGGQVDLELVAPDHL